MSNDEPIPDSSPKSSSSPDACAPALGPSSRLRATPEMIAAVKDWIAQNFGDVLAYPSQEAGLAEELVEVVLSFQEGRPSGG
jgi:altronate dehydratase